MKETRYFYVPNAASSNELPEDEAMHALRVLRLKSGDRMMLMDGNGNYYLAEVTLAATRHCIYKILETMPQKPQWEGHFHVVVAPTKMLERMEWMLEKMTEVGVDEVSFINCKNSERRVLKTLRLEKIVVSAVKQSHKAWKPVIHEIEPFKNFISVPRSGAKFIAHCYEEIPRSFLFDELAQLPVSGDVVVLVGPEGDFSIDEVRMAMDAGYIPVHLGKSRLRTETAGLSVAMMLQLSQNRKLK